MYKYMFIYFIYFLFVEKRAKVSMTSCREKAPIVYTLSDGASVKLYSHDGTPRCDFIKHGVRRMQILSLVYAQLCTLVHMNTAIVDAIKKGNTFKYDIGSLVYVCVECYRDTWSVTLRQYYIDENGVEKPGRWGVHFDVIVWVSFSRKHLHKICKYIFI